MKEGDWELREGRKKMSQPFRPRHLAGKNYGRFVHRMCLLNCAGKPVDSMFPRSVQDNPSCLVDSKAFGHMSHPEGIWFRKLLGTRALICLLSSIKFIYTRFQALFVRIRRCALRCCDG